MSGTVVPGGPRVAAELADAVTVQQDGATIVQSANALNFEGATVSEDGHGRATVSITGGGGTIHTDDTLTGAGTSGSPLGVDTANLTGLVAVDHDATLTGNGTAGSPIGVNPGHVPVVTDGTTITGNGTTGNALTVNATSLAGLVAVDHDATLVGNGTAGSHLGVNVGHIPVTTDGATVTGDGTTGNAITVNAAGLTGLVAVDHDTTLVGNGTAGSHLGVNVGAIPVAVDGTTITGDGTTGNPLVAVGGGGGGVNVLDQDSTVVAGASGIRFLGTPVTVTVDGIDPTVADVTVTVPSQSSFTVTLPADVGSGFIPGQVGYQDPALSHRFTPSICNDTETDAQVLGMCTQNQVGTTQVVCVGGVVTLTAPQWANVIAEGGPLIEGVYYLADGTGGTPGLITRTKPTTSGFFVTVVGYAMRLNGLGSTLSFVVRPSPAVLIP